MKTQEVNRVYIIYPKTGRLKTDKGLVSTKIKPETLLKALEKKKQGLPIFYDADRDRLLVKKPEVNLEKRQQNRIKEELAAAKRCLIHLTQHIMNLEKWLGGESDVSAFSH